MAIENPCKIDRTTCEYSREIDGTMKPIGRCRSIRGKKNTIETMHEHSREMHRAAAVMRVLCTSRSVRAIDTVGRGDIILIVQQYYSREIDTGSRITYDKTTNHNMDI